MSWIYDNAGEINWGKVILVLGLSYAAGYLSVRTQRTASSSDIEETRGSKA